MEREEGRREWGWEVEGRGEKMSHFTDPGYIWSIFIPLERNKVLMRGRLLGARSREKEGLLIAAVQALSREKHLDKIAWLFHWAIENQGA